MAWVSFLPVGGRLIAQSDSQKILSAPTYWELGEQLCLIDLGK